MGRIRPIANRRPRARAAIRRVAGGRHAPPPRLPTRLRVPAGRDPAACPAHRSRTKRNGWRRRPPAGDSRRPPADPAGARPPPGPVLGPAPPRGPDCRQCPRPAGPSARGRSVGPPAAAEPGQHGRDADPSADAADAVAKGIRGNNYRGSVSWSTDIASLFRWAEICLKIMGSVALPRNFGVFKLNKKFKNSKVSDSTRSLKT